MNSRTGGFRAARMSRRALLAALSGTVALAGCGGLGGDDLPPPGTVGKAALLLPLSGSRASLGAVLRAAAALGGNPVGPGAEVEVLDAGDSEEQAVAAARAALDAGANMLLGPLFSGQARAVAAAAGRTPVVSLSNDAAIAGGNLWVFGITPLQSARNVFGFAAGRGIRRLAVVVPPGELGQRSAAAAQTAAAALGLELLPPVVTEGTGGLSAGVGGADGVYLPVVGPGFEAQAAALGAMDVQILGSDQWSAINPWQVRGLQGAWFAAPDPIRFEGFALALEAEIETEAGIVAGLAFDAVEMARVLGRIGKQDRDGLLREAGFEGVLGPYRFLPDGRCDRGLAILNVVQGTTTLIGASSV